MMRAFYKIITNKYLWLFLFFIQELLMRAHDCSSPGDCEETAGYNAAVAITGGAIAVVVGIMSSGMIPPDVLVDDTGADQDVTDEELEEFMDDIGLNDEPEDVVDQDVTDEELEDFIDDIGLGDDSDIVDVDIDDSDIEVVNIDTDVKIDKKPDTDKVDKKPDTNKDADKNSDKKQDDLNVVDRLKGAKGVLDNAEIYERFVKLQQKLHDAYTGTKIFDKAGKFIIKNEKDLERIRKALMRNSKFIPKFKISKRFGKFSKGFDYAAHVYDAYQNYQKNFKKRGYTKDDRIAAVTQEALHKFLVIVATKNPVVGAIDGLVGIIAPDYTIESNIRKVEDAWHDTSKKIANAFYDNSKELNKFENKEMNRYIKMIKGKKNLSDEQKMVKIRKIRSIFIKKK